MKIDINALFSRLFDKEFFIFIKLYIIVMLVGLTVSGIVQFVNTRELYYIIGSCMTCTMALLMYFNNSEISKKAYQLCKNNKIVAAIIIVAAIGMTVPEPKESTYTEEMRRRNESRDAYENSKKTIVELDKFTSFNRGYEQLAAPKILYACDGDLKYIAARGMNNYNDIYEQAKNSCNEFKIMKSEK